LSRISQIQIKNLKEFELYSCDGCGGKRIDQFTKNHPNLVEFKLNLDPIEESTHLKVLESTLKSLKNLKKLMMFFPFRKRSNVSASADGICKLIGEDAPQLDTLALNVGFNDVDASKLEIDREFWEECMGVIRESFQSALPNLKFKILSSYRSDPWN
jgi:hypothetical protein